MHRFRLTAIAGPLALLALSGWSAAGCHGAYLADDIDIELQLSLLSGPSDELHLPYVAGTQVTLYGRHTDPDESTGGWHLVSSDSQVLRIDSQANGQARCTAVSPGEAEVRVYSHAGDASPLHSSTITVMAPTRAELYAHGPLLLGQPSQVARVQQPLILVGGTATLLVRYFNQDTPLFGNGVLEARVPTSTAPDSITIEEQTTFLFENREWLQITPHSPDPFRVELEASGVHLGSLELHGVPVHLVDHVELFGENESEADDGDLLLVLAQAYNAANRPIYGVAFEWDLDGVVLDGLGDLFRYEYRSHSPRQLGASLDGLYNDVIINASAGYVSSTNNIGCTMTPGMSPDSAPSALCLLLLSVLLAVSVLARHRRRRTHPSS